MKVACGTDIIEVVRIKESIEQLEKFLDRVYTSKEIEYCESKNAQKYQHYAARFAAKEAIYKAISPLIKGKEISWKSIEIENEESGKPKVNFVNINLGSIKDIDISISHIKEYAMATAVITYE